MQLPWHVTGPRFNRLHQMFTVQHKELWNALDRIAGRIRAMDHPVAGTYRKFIRLVSIKEIDGVPQATETVGLLLAVQEATPRTARTPLPVVAAANDQTTAPLRTQRLDLHQRRAWMLHSLLEE